MRDTQRPRGSAGDTFLLDASDDLTDALLVLQPAPADDGGEWPIPATWRSISAARTVPATAPSLDQRRYPGIMTAAFDDMQLRDLVELLTPEEQHDLRPVVLRLVAGHERSGSAVGRRPSAGRLSFTGSVQAAPDFASTSQDTLNRELGGRA